MTSNTVSRIGFHSGVSDSHLLTSFIRYTLFPLLTIITCDKMIRFHSADRDPRDSAAGVLHDNDQRP